MYNAHVQIFLFIPCASPFIRYPGIKTSSLMRNIQSIIIISWRNLHFNHAVRKWKKILEKLAHLKTTLLQVVFSYIFHYCGFLNTVILFYLLIFAAKRLAFPWFQFLRNKIPDKQEKIYRLVIGTILKYIVFWLESIVSKR